MAQERTRKLILCFDGTWNHPDDDKVPEDAQIETNARRLYEAILDPPAAPDQVKWYDEGVGISNNWYERLGGGAFGLGLDVKILDGYRYLSGAYEPGDRVYLFGFSRGAYSARSLLGLVRKCGLLHRDQLAKADEAYAIYRSRHLGDDCPQACAFRKRYGRDVAVHMIGLFDSVGALGVPLESFAAFNKDRYQFHDVNLSDNVAHAYHAMGLDEHRHVYSVSLWDPPAPTSQTLEQRWFIGDHSDVGGGQPDRRLSDLPLRWMMERAMAHGLILHPYSVPLRIERNHLAPVNDSYTAFLDGSFSLFHDPYFRPVGQTLYGNEVLDDSVLRKLDEDPRYQPVNQGVFVG